MPSIDCVGGFSPKWEQSPRQLATLDRVCSGDDCNEHFLLAEPILILFVSFLDDIRYLLLVVAATKLGNKV
jgi:hypothetical protein